MKLMRETWILGAICFLDLILTLWLLNTGQAKEANPVMQAALGMGVMWFVALKCAYTVGPLTLLEMVGRRHALVVRRYLRLGIGVYLAMHLASIGSALMAVYLVRRF